ncbi:hypothetical protein F5883DRAFT_530105 [Diaporthe sp. PMI_573]|nr:hypothetical protein F5883DRAFT_530105 [Diaporthaceae sp. PMI_573]
MSAQLVKNQKYTIQKEPGSYPPLGEGKPALVDFVEDSILTIQDCLRQISDMTNQAFCAAVKHPCVPASHVLALETAFHQEAQKLAEAIVVNKRLQTMYGEALAEAVHLKQELTVLYGRMHELEHQVSEYAIRVEEQDAGERLLKPQSN